MSFNIYYFFWIVFVSIQTAFFIRFYIKSREQQKKWDKEYEKQSQEELDTRVFLVYNNKAYWQENDLMYRGNYRDGKIFMKTIEKVDPFEIRDIGVEELFTIMDKLKGAVS